MSVLYLAIGTPNAEFGGQVNGPSGFAVTWGLPNDCSTSELTGAGNDHTVSTYSGTLAKAHFGTHWLSDPVTSTVTVSGTITLYWPGYESSMSANAGPGYLVRKVSPTGEIVSTILDSSRGVELGTSLATVSWTATPTSTTLNPGDRILITPYQIATGGTQTNGYTVTFRQGGSTANNAAARVDFAETISFSATPSAYGTVLHVRSTTSDANPGASDERVLSLTQGSETNGNSPTQYFSTSTVNGFTSPVQCTLSAGGTALEWISPQLNAFTLSGWVGIKVTTSAASTISGGMSVRAELAVVSSTGGSPTVYAATNMLVGSSAWVGQPVWLYGNSISVSQGQRLRLRLFVDDSDVAALATGNTFRVAWDQDSTTGAWARVELSQTVTEFASGTTYTQTCAATGSGAVTATRLLTYRRTYTVNGAGSPALIRAISRTFANTGTGTPSVAKGVSKTFAATGTGTTSMTKGAVLSKLVQVTGAGAAAFSRVLTYARTLATTGTGTASLTRKIAVTLAAVGSGTASVSKRMFKTLQAAGTGAATATQQLLTGVPVLVQVVGTGTASLTKKVSAAFSVAASGVASVTKTAKVTLLSTGAGTASVTKVVRKTLAAIGAGAPTLARRISLTLSVASTGAASVLKTVRKTLAAVGSGAVTASQSTVQAVPVLVQVVGTGAATLTKKVSKTFTAAGAGTVALSRRMMLTFSVSGTGASTVTRAIKKTFAATGSGAVTLSRGWYKVLTVTATGAASLTRKISVTLSAAGTATASLIRKIAKTFAAVGSGTVSYSDAMTKVVSLVSGIVGTVTGNQTFIIAPPPPTGWVIKLRRAMFRYIRRR